jgi:soluble lytic murein transglycosylase-like protein
MASFLASFMASLRAFVAHLASRLRTTLAQPRGRVGAVVAAVLLLGMCVGLLALTQRPPQKDDPLAARAADQALAIPPTSAVTATNTLAPTKTNTPKPRPTSKPVVAPKPPPIPTAPPQPTATAVPPGTPTATPTPCGPTAYQGNNPSQAQIRAALQSAASAYGLPVNLLYAVAWQESKWHQDVYSCDGGIGLMQIQYYTAPWLNSESESVCGLGATSYDAQTLQGNANLGAKFLKWLWCFYSYWGNNGGTSVSNPGVYTAAWYYQRAGLPFPDSASATSLCKAVYNDPQQPWYPALPSANTTSWSCPFSATSGDATLLDITVSAYNEGPGNVSKYGINNWWYVSQVEGYIPQFAAGTLPM